MVEDGTAHVAGGARQEDPVGHVEGLCKGWRMEGEDEVGGGDAVGMFPQSLQTWEGVWVGGKGRILKKRVDRRAT